MYVRLPRCLLQTDMKMLICCRKKVINCDQVCLSGSIETEEFSYLYFYYLMRSIEKILCPYRVKIVVFVVAHFEKRFVKDNLFLLY